MTKTFCVVHRIHILHKIPAFLLYTPRHNDDLRRPTERSITTGLAWAWMGMRNAGHSLAFFS